VRVGVMVGIGGHRDEQKNIRCVSLCMWWQTLTYCHLQSCRTAVKCHYFSVLHGLLCSDTKALAASLTLFLGAAGNCGCSIACYMLEFSKMKNSVAMSAIQRRQFIAGYKVSNNVNSSVPIFNSICVAYTCGNRWQN